MDEKTIIYLVLGILYFLFQVWSSSKKKEKNAPKETNTTSSNEPKKTLAELLREVERQTTGNMPTTTTSSTTTFSTEKPVRKSKQKKQPENSNFAYQEKYQKHSPIETTLSKSGRFDVFDQREKPNKYAILLKNPSNVKQAIIMNEILKRKY